MDPIVVDFPLRVEWCAPNTPGYKVPSHGTDLLGQTYAYDFVQVDWNYPGKFRFFKKPLWSAVLFGIRLKNCLGWRSPIHAPFDAEVLECENNVRERNPVHLARDLIIAFKNGLFFKPRSNSEMKSVLGNYIILKGADCYAMLAHGHTGSMRIRAGDRVKAGQQLAEVGHSGNSTAPHLHFQLMDRPELMDAKGLPCCFRQYEIYREGEWHRVNNGIPGRDDRIRLL